MSDVCPHCGIFYCDFRTGLSFRDVRAMFWSGSDDKTTWAYKRRHTVLGKWHQIKQELWRYHVSECAERLGPTLLPWAGASPDNVPF